MNEKGTRDEVNAGVSDAEAAPVTARLCYVDDSRTSAYVVRRLLKPFGYQVDHFASAEPAFVALVQEDYDLLLTDLKVSPTGMDGDDLIRTLRQSGHPKLSQLPIIVITGATDAEALVEVYDAGANQVMKKPVDADELDGHIRRLLLVVKRTEPTIAEVKPERMDRRSIDATVVPLHPVSQLRHESERSPKPPLKDQVDVNKDDIPVLNDLPPVSEPVAPESSTPPVREPKQPLEDSSILRAMEKESAAVADAKITQEAMPATTPEATPATTKAESSDKKAIGEDSEPPVIIETPSEGKVFDATEEVVIIEPEMREDRNARTHTQTEDHNILHDIEQYPLVVNQRSGLFSGFSVLNMLRSLVELAGVRSLLKRALVVAIILAASFLTWDIYFNQGRPVNTVLVKSGEIFQSVTVPGRVVSKLRVNVSSTRAGRLVKVLVKDGDKVKQGQVLARIDDRELKSRLNRAKASLAAAREDISLAERTLKRLSTAHKKGAVARRFVEDAEVDLRSARIKSGIVVEEVRSATLDFDNQKIKAPFAGTVTSRYAEIGQWVGPTETLFTLVDESQREIEVRVDAADSVAIDVGQVVVVSSDAFPGLEWKESVVRLGSEAGGKRNLNSVKVYVSLGNDAPVFRYGQQIDADIRTAWNPNTLKIPFEALISRDGQTMVAVLENGQVRMKIVETGIEDFAMAEIKQGLNAGEMVILSKGVVLHNGDRAYPRRDNK